MIQPTERRKLKMYERWLLTNRSKFGTCDGLPGEFHRGLIYSQITPRCRVAIVTPHGQIQLGQAVMLGPAGWVLNLGGQHGIPGIADQTNTIWCTGARV